MNRNQENLLKTMENSNKTNTDLHNKIKQIQNLQNSGMKLLYLMQFPFIRNSFHIFDTAKAQSSTQIQKIIEKSERLENENRQLIQKLTEVTNAHEKLADQLKLANKMIEQMQPEAVDAFNKEINDLKAENLK